MIKSIKKRVFWLIALQRKNRLGKLLFSASQSFLNALNNKINDPDLSGENWFLQNLNHSEIKVVFDVGANVGNWSKKIVEVNPEAEIHAFEPVPATFEKLKNNLKGFPNLKLNLLGLSSESGKLNFNFYPDSSYLSSAFEHDLGKEGQLIEVDVIQGDQYCEQNDIQQIDLLKIDTEGFESKVLKGFTSMFESNKIRLVQFEYGPMAIDSKFLLSDFYKFFETHGFRVGKIFPKWVDFKPYSKDMENFVLSNFVAVHLNSNYLISKLEVSN